VKKKIVITSTIIVFFFIFGIFIQTNYSLNKENNQLTEHFLKSKSKKKINYFKVKNFENINHITLSKIDFLPLNFLVIKIKKENLSQKKFNNDLDLNISANIELNSNTYKLIFLNYNDTLDKIVMKKKFNQSSKNNLKQIIFLESTTINNAEDRFYNTEFLKKRVFYWIFNKEKIIKIIHAGDNQIKNYFVSRFFFNFEINKDFVYYLKIPKNVYKVSLRYDSFFVRNTIEFQVSNLKYLPFFFNNSLNLKEIIFYSENEIETTKNLDFYQLKKELFSNCQYPNYLVTNFPFIRLDNLIKNCVNSNVSDINNNYLFINPFKIIYEDSDNIYFALKLNNLSMLFPNLNLDASFNKINFESFYLYDKKIDKSKIEISIYKSENVDDIFSQDFITIPQSKVGQIDYLKPIKSFFFFSNKLINKNLYKCYTLDTNLVDYFSFSSNSGLENKIKLKIISKLKNTSLSLDYNYLFHLDNSEQFQKLCFDDFQFTSDNLQLVKLNLFKKTSKNKIFSNIYNQNIPLILNNKKSTEISSIYNYDTFGYKILLNKDDETFLNSNITHVIKNSKYLLITIFYKNKSTKDSFLKCPISMDLYFSSAINKHLIDKKSFCDNLVFLDLNSVRNKEAINLINIKLKNNSKKKFEVNVSGVLLSENFYSNYNNIKLYFNSNQSP